MTRDIKFYPSRVIWNGSIDRFELFRNSVEGHYGQIGAGYLFDTDFQAAYLEKGVDCFVDFMDEVPTAYNGFYLSNLYEPGIPRHLMMSGIIYIDVQCIVRTK
jgi:hypothetical protein